MHRHALAIPPVLAAAALLAGCANTELTRRELPAGRAQVWPVLQQVLAGRAAVEREDARRGEIVGTTAPRRVSDRRPGLGGELLGLRSGQTQRRRIVARLASTDGACRLTVSAWVQRLSDVDAASMRDFQRDPVDAARDEMMTTAGRPAWVDVRRDLVLETEVLDAVSGRFAAASRPAAAP